MAKTQEKLRVATYIESDLLKWIKEQAKKERITESAFIRQALAEKMEAIRGQNKT